MLGGGGPAACVGGKGPLRVGEEGPLRVVLGRARCGPPYAEGYLTYGRLLVACVAHARERHRSPPPLDSQPSSVSPSPSATTAFAPARNPHPHPRHCRLEAAASAKLSPSALQPFQFDNPSQNCIQFKT